MCVVDRCPEPPLSTTVELATRTKETVMTEYTNPALEAELAYRRQRLEAAARRRQTHWFPHPWRRGR
jgi:hypothetical protein